jgi:hypothetical protein
MTLATDLAPAPSRFARLRGPLLTAGTISAATVALHFRDPHVQHSRGVCPLYALTGIYCPGCGGLRAVNDLTNAHVGAAASSNLLFVCAIPFVVALFARWSLAAWQGRRLDLLPPMSTPVRYALLALVVVFTLARNWPGSWLAP